MKVVKMPHADCRDFLAMQPRVPSVRGHASVPDKLIPQVMSEIEIPRLRALCADRCAARPACRRLRSVELDAPAIALLAAIAAAPTGLAPAQLVAFASWPTLAAMTTSIGCARGWATSTMRWVCIRMPVTSRGIRMTRTRALRWWTPAAPGCRRPHCPPGAWTSSAARTRSLRVVAQLNTHRFVTILAAGGMGKTTVAVAAVHAAAADYPDGVYVVDLAPVVDPSLLAQRVASTVGCLTGHTSAHEVLQQWAHERRALVVLDSCEHVIDAAAQLAEALGGAGSKVAVLATSREPLRARGEWLYRLAPMRLPQPGEVVSASQSMAFPALRLFVERAKAVAPGFVLTDADVPQLVSLCTRLDGIALAIEIVAARVDSLDIAGLSHQLETLLLHLPVRRGNAPARHSTLAALLEWSYRLLSPVEQTVLRRLSVFRSSFSTAMAEQVVADAEVGAEDVQETLLDLVAKSLVAPGRGDDPDLRRLLDTTRAYAGQKLDEARERKAVSLRHARWLAGVLAEADSAWNRMTRPHWMSRYSPLIDDIRAALDWAFTPDGDVTLGIELTIASFAIGRQMLLVDEFTDRVKLAIDAIAGYDDNPAATLDPAGADVRRKRLTFLIACLGTGSGVSLLPALETAATSLTDADQMIQRFLRLQRHVGHGRVPRRFQGRCHLGRQDGAARRCHWRPRGPSRVGAHPGAEPALRWAALAGRREGAWCPGRGLANDSPELQPVAGGASRVHARDAGADAVDAGPPRQRRGDGGGGH